MSRFFILNHILLFLGMRFMDNAVGRFIPVPYSLQQILSAENQPQPTRNQSDARIVRVRIPAKDRSAAMRTDWRGLRPIMILELHSDFFEGR